MFAIIHIDKLRCILGVLMKNYKKDALVFKAFCDENRLQILDMLKEGEICACKILEKLNIVQSTLSHHMKILLDSKIVNGRKEGKWTYYSINKQAFEEAKNILNYYIENRDKVKTNKKIKCKCD